MIRRLILSVVVAIVVTLACILLGQLLVALNVNMAVVVGGFLGSWSTVIGVLAGIWFFFVGNLHV